MCHGPFSLMDPVNPVLLGEGCWLTGDASTRASEESNSIRSEIPGQDSSEEVVWWTIEAAQPQQQFDCAWWNGCDLWVRCTFIQIAKKKTHLKTLSSKKHFHSKTLSSKNTFVQNTFIQKHFPSQNHFIQKRRQFHPRHFHPEMGTSNDTFIPNHFHPTLNPKSQNT